MCIQTNAQEAQTDRIGTETEGSVQEKQENEEDEEDEEEGREYRGDCASDVTHGQVATGKKRDHRSYPSI